jgi:hypothetical protein
MNKNKVILLFTFALLISCTDNNEELIDVSVSNFTINIDENPNINESLGVLEATTNQGNLTFSITEQVPNNAFEINATTGELVVLNNELFNYEINPIITGVVKVQNGEVFDTGNIIINLNNINEPKLLKQITDQDDYWHKYFYNDEDQLILITRTSNQITLDSTYLFYNSDVLSRSLQRIHVPVTGIVNTELIYNQFNATNASGTYKIFKEDGTVFQDKTFEYTFVNDLIKSIGFFNLDGSKTSEKIYTHNETGDLTNWAEIWYNSDGTIQSERQSTFTEWNSNGLKTQSLLFWNYRIANIPNLYISSSNCLRRNEDGQLYTYSFEYDADGNVIKYNSIDEDKFINLEYYE